MLAARAAKGDEEGGCAEALEETLQQASARALYVRMMCDRRLWPVWAIDAVRRAASAARSPTADRLCIWLYWVCGCIRIFTISYRADLSRPLHDDTRSQSNLCCTRAQVQDDAQTDDHEPPMLSNPPHAMRTRPKYSTASSSCAFARPGEDHGHAPRPP